MLKFANRLNPTYDQGMRSSIVSGFLFFVLTLASWGETPPQAQPERGVWPSLKRTWHATVDGAESAVNATGSAVKSASKSVVGIFSAGSDTKTVKKLPLELSVTYRPSPLVLGQTQQLAVSVRVFNTGKRTQMLEFPSTLRADAVIRDASGQIVSRASEESGVRSEASIVTINPGERLKYPLNLPTHAMSAGKVYSLECALVGQAGISTRVSITPR